jgi:REP element-mobilizing transposase RayT
MARKLRIEYPGALYHLMSHGDRREPLFKKDQDRELFLETLGQACGKTGWPVHAYGLRSHPFHLVLETPPPNLSAARKWFLGTYTSRFNPFMKARRGDQYGPELRAADEAQAQKLVRAERRRRHWPERELARRRQGDAPKVAMAWRLRRETPMTLKCIAARLQMAAWTSLSNAWTQQRRKEKKYH